MYFIVSIIFFLISAVCGGIYVYQEVTPKYYGSELAVLRDFADAGSTSAVEDLREYTAYMNMHNTLGYVFWICLALFVVTLVIAILIKKRNKKL